MKLVFAGTPVFAATILEALVASGSTPQLVLSQPDRPQGRGRKMQASPVKALAQDLGIPVFQPVTLSGKKQEGREAIEQITAAPFDVLIVAAYGLMIPRPLLVFPRFGAINVHASLLPRWRGAAPVEYAILQGDAETGVSLMQMDTGLDTGAVLASATTPIGCDETGMALADRLSTLGANLLCASLPRLGCLQPHPQDDRFATYAPKLTPEIAAIDWRRPAEGIHNQVRALAGRETAWTRLPHGSGELRIRIHAGVHLPGGSVAAPGQIVPHPRSDLIVVQTGQDLFGVSHLQIPMGKGTIQPASAARNGFPFLRSADTRFR